MLVPLRMGGRRLVLVRLWHSGRRGLGRGLRVEWLGGAAQPARRRCSARISLQVA